VSLESPAFFFFFDHREFGIFPFLPRTVGGTGFLSLDNSLSCSFYVHSGMPLPGPYPNLFQFCFLSINHISFLVVNSFFEMQALVCGRCLLSYRQFSPAFSQFSLFHLPLCLTRRVAAPLSSISSVPLRSKRSFFFLFLEPLEDCRTRHPFRRPCICPNLLFFDPFLGVSFQPDVTLLPSLNFWQGIFLFFLTLQKAPLCHLFLDFFANVFFSTAPL